MRPSQKANEQVAQSTSKKQAANKQAKSSQDVKGVIRGMLI